MQVCTMRPLIPLDLAIVHSFRPRRSSKLALALADFASREPVENLLCLCEGIYRFARKQWGYRILFATTVAVVEAK